jgi:hypothetical protein
MSGSPPPADPGTAPPPAPPPPPVVITHQVAPATPVATPPPVVVPAGSRTVDDYESHIRSLNAEAAGHRHAAATAKAEADAAKAEAAELRAKAEQTDQLVAAARLPWKNRALNAELREAARKAGFVDPASVLTFIKADTTIDAIINIDDESGEITGVKEAIDKLEEVKPALFSEGTPARTPRSTGSTTPVPPPNPNPPPAQARQMTTEQYRDWWAGEQRRLQREHA